MGLSRLSPDALAAWVEASCASQGLAVKITDPTVVRRVGALLGAATDPGPLGGRGRKRSGTRPPNDPDAVADQNDPAPAPAPAERLDSRDRQGSRGHRDHPTGQDGSVPPGHGDAGGVEFAGAGGSWADGDVVDEGCDDRVLAREVQAAPRSA